MAADPVRLQAQLHKLQAQYEELVKEKALAAEGTWTYIVGVAMAASAHGRTSEAHTSRALGGVGRKPRCTQQRSRCRGC
jgi:hypothetical protein